MYDSGIKRNYPDVLLLLLVYPAVWFISCFFRFHYISTDGIQYLTLGKNLIQTGSYTSSFGFVPGWIQPPLYPFFSGLLSTVFPLREAGILFSLLVTAGMAILMFRFIRKEYDRESAVLVLIVLLSHPLLMRENLRVLTEPLYTFFNVLCFLVLYRLVYPAGNSSPLKKIALLAFLTAWLVLSRPEGILYVVLIGGILLIKVNWKGLVLYLTVWIVLMLPYGIFVQHHYGTFNIIPKITWNSRLAVIVDDYSKHHPAVDLSTKNVEEIAWYSLDSLNQRTFASEIMNNRKYRELKKTVERKYNWFQLRRQLQYNFVLLRDVIFRSFAFPLLFLIFVLAGVWELFNNRRSLLFSLVLWMIPSAYFIISHVEERFFFIFVPFLSIIAARGILYLARGSRFKIIALAGLIIFMLLNFTIYYSHFFSIQEKHEQRYILGQNLKEVIPAGQSVCSRNPEEVFWGDFPALLLPLCNSTELRDYMRYHDSHYLVLDNDPSLTFDILKNELWTRQNDQFELLKVFRFSGNEVRLYKLRDTAS